MSLHLKGLEWFWHNPISGEKNKFAKRVTVCSENKLQDLQYLTEDFTSKSSCLKKKKTPPKKPTKQKKKQNKTQIPKLIQFKTSCKE